MHPGCCRRFDCACRLFDRPTYALAAIPDLQGAAFDRFLRQSGISSMLNRSGSVRAVEVVARTAFWLILMLGVVTGISAFNTQLTSRITETFVFLLPKFLAAAAILVAGLWVGQYLGVILWSGLSTRVFPRDAGSRWQFTCWWSLWQLLPRQITSISPRTFFSPPSSSS